MRTAGVVVWPFSTIRLSKKLSKIAKKNQCNVRTLIEHTYTFLATAYLVLI